MIVVLVLGLILTLTYWAVGAFESSASAYSAVQKVYRKEQGLVFLNSALYKLAELLDKDNNDYDALNEFWARPYSFETPIGTIEAKIVDLDRYIDVNLVGRNRKITRVFENLLSLLQIDPQLLELLLEWKGDRPEEFWPAKYPPKGKPLDSVHEIALFWDKKGDLYGREEESGISYPGLLELLTVHSGGRININTAPYWVIRALSPYIDDTLAREIIAYRKEHPFRSVQDLLNVEGIDMDLLYRIEDLLTTRSRFFKITLKLEGGNTALTVEAVYDVLNKRFVEKRIY